MKCHHIYDEELGKILIPGCMGTAVYGIERCTCRDQSLYTERQLEAKRVRELKDQLKEAEKENARLNRIIRNIYKKRNEKFKGRKKEIRKRD